MAIGWQLENKKGMSTEADGTLQQEELEIQRLILAPPKVKNSSVLTYKVLAQDTS